MAANGHPTGPVAHHYDNLNQQLHTVRFGMWLFLVTEVLFFGGIMCAYTAYRIWFPKDFEAASAALNVGIASVNTFLLLLSSLTITLGIRSAYTGDKAGLKRNLILTIVLGTAFLGLKAREYQLDVHEGLLPGKDTALTSEAKKKLEEEREKLRPVVTKLDSLIAEQKALAATDRNKEFELRVNASEARARAEKARQDKKLDEQKAAETQAQAFTLDADAAANRARLPEYKQAELAILYRTVQDRLHFATGFNENIGVILEKEKYATKSNESVDAEEILKDADGVAKLSVLPSEADQKTRHKEAEKRKAERYDPNRTQLFFMFYYSMTGLHVVHMIVGLGLLTWQYLLAAQGFFNHTSRYIYIEVMSLYWHFVDMVWMFLLPLLYLCGPHSFEQAIHQFKHALGMH